MTRGLNLSIMGESDNVVLSGLVWKFLQLCCINSTHASTTFQAAQPELNGLEVWRSLIWEINQGRSSRALLLRSGVQELPLAKDLKDVSTALNACDIVLRDYKAAGGQRPCDQELKQSFLSSLPEMLQRDLVLKAACPEPCEAFKYTSARRLPLSCSALDGNEDVERTSLGPSQSPKGSKKWRSLVASVMSFSPS